MAAVARIADIRLGEGGGRNTGDRPVFLDFVIPSVVEESLTIFSVTDRDEEEEAEAE